MINATIAVKLGNMKAPGTNQWQGWREIRREGRRRERGKGAGERGKEGECEGFLAAVTFQFNSEG